MGCLITTGWDHTLKPDPDNAGGGKREYYIFQPFTIASFIDLILFNLSWQWGKYFVFLLSCSVFAGTSLNLATQSPSTKPGALFRPWRVVKPTTFSIGPHADSRVSWTTIESNTSVAQQAVIAAFVGLYRSGATRCKLLKPRFFIARATEPTLRLSPGLTSTIWIRSFSTVQI